MAPRDLTLSPPGLVKADFAPIGRNGLGDKLNAYPHSMAWFNNRLIVGTTRSNLCLFKISKIRKNIENWPVDCPEYIFDQDMRAQIWHYDPTHHDSGENAGWTMAARAPWIDAKGERLPRELGYRGMCVFQGKSDDAPHLYVSTYTPARGQGTRILRSPDGVDFAEIPMPEGFGSDIITLRLVVPFKGRLFTSPTGKAEGNPNMSGNAVIFATDDPVSGNWQVVNTPGFGDPGNIGVFEMIDAGDYLYAGTGNLSGFQIWRTRAEGPPPFKWQQVIEKGGYRGALNQGAASLCAHDGMVYVGSGIQHGGIDQMTGVGIGGPELIRIHPDGSWDMIIGRERPTPVGLKSPLSGFSPGFDSLFTGYFWRMASHDGWLYLGTFDWAVMMRFADRGKWPAPFRRMVDRIGLEKVIDMFGGADLYRSRDGENWLPVTVNGFGNAYNYGVRTLQSTPFGLAAGFVNPFGPRVGSWEDGEFRYRDNPDGGMEIWLGSKRNDT